MKMKFLAVLSAFMILALTGCGGGDGNTLQPAPQSVVVTTILSDPGFDGDIQRSSLTGAFIITQGMSLTVQSVFAGIHPTSGLELRSFLDFRLTGANGVPGNAIIQSAFLDIVINSIDPQPLIGTIPVRVDLVSFQPPNLVGTDFDRTLLPALATTTVSPPISRADFGQHVKIDVTTLMVEAQRLSLVDFQVRIMEDLGTVTHGIIEINDTTGINRSTLAPALQVTYF